MTADRDELPPGVEQFILQNIRTVDHLEALQAICQDRDRWWTGATLGQAIGTSGATADEILEELCSANLLRVKVGSAVAYQFGPGSSETERIVEELVAALRYRRGRIYNLIASGSSRALRNFADAFRLWRRDRG